MSAVLQAVGIGKTFTEGRQSVSVLHDVSLELRRGEVVALEGPSGSGKTTLLSILGCILTPTTGTLTVNGENVPVDEPSALPLVRRRHFGFVLQQFNLFPALTAHENVEYALNLRGARGTGARAAAKTLLQAVGLGERLDFLPRDLSGGQKQRVAIARALAGSPPILFADEPTANLDAASGEKVLDLFTDLVRRENRALLVVTHDPKVRRVADRVIRIADGRLLN